MQSGRNGGEVEGGGREQIKELEGLISKIKRAESVKLE